MSKHKETHEFKKRGVNYKLTATVHGRAGAYSIEMQVKDLEPIVSEYEHVHTGELVRNTYFETWQLDVNDFNDVQQAKDWITRKLPKLINEFNQGGYTLWEQRY